MCINVFLQSICVTRYTIVYYNFRYTIVEHFDHSSSWLFASFVLQCALNGSSIGWGCVKARRGAEQRQRGSLFTFLSEFSYFNVSATLLSHNPETLWRSTAVIISGVEFVEVADA